MIYLIGKELKNLILIVMQMVCGILMNSFEDLDNSGFWNCINCSGEWGYIDWRTANGGTDTLGYTIRHPEDVINTSIAMETGAITFGDNGPQAQYWTPVGVDEYSAVSGLSEAEYIESPLIGVDGNPIVAPGLPIHLFIQY